MTQLRRRQKEEIIRQTLARISPAVAGTAPGPVVGVASYNGRTGNVLPLASDQFPAAQLDANGVTLDVNVINDGEVLKRVGLTIVSVPVGAPGAHHTTHESGGTDQISVAGLTGLLATPQTPAAHGHVEGDVTGLVADLAAKVPATRAIATTAPLTGGGDLSADRTFAVSDFVGSGASHARGTVPDPGAVAGTSKFLREDATWAPAASPLPATGKAGNVLADSGAAWVSEAWGLNQQSLPEDVVTSARHYFAVGPFTIPAGRTLTVTAGDTFLVAE